MPLLHSPAHGFTDAKYKSLVNSIYRNSSAACYRQFEKDDKLVRRDTEWLINRAKFMEECMAAQGFPIEHSYGDTVYLSAISVALAKEHYVKQMDKKVEKEIREGRIASSSSSGSGQDTGQVKTKYLYISPKQDTGKKVVRPLWLR